MFMDRFDELYPRFDESGRNMIRTAYNIAAEALKEHKRSNGNPFIEHPDAVAKIAYEEIGLSAECIAAVYLHEATRFVPETDITSAKFSTRLTSADMDATTSRPAMPGSLQPIRT